MSGKFANYFSVLGDASGADEELSHVGRMFNDSKISRIHIGHNFDEDEADAFRKGLKTTTTMTQLDFTNYVPIRIVQAVSEGLKQNNTVRNIYYKEIHDEQPGDTEPQDSLHFLRDIFAIPRIDYQIKLKNNSSVLQIINGQCANYITNLDVTVGSAQLDELLYGLRNNKVLDTMTIELKQDTSKCENLSLFGNFERLGNLKIQIRSDELEQLFAALKNVSSLSKLDLSNSIITTEGARHLADLIVKLPNLSYLNLSNCQIGNKQFSIICRGILNNNTINHINVQDNPFDRLDLVDRTLTERKKILTLETDTLDINMAKIFDITNLFLRGHNFDGLRAAKILWFHLTNSLMHAQQVTNLFNELMYSRQIFSLRIHGYESDDILSEYCKHLAISKTLKWVNITHTQFTEKSFKLLCEFIEKNNTLQSLAYDGTFTILKEDDSHIPHGPLLEALKKNTSLTSVDFHRLKCEDREVEEVLEANPYLTFTELADRNPGSRASELNAKNMRNINRRIRDIKCNVVILARSYLSSVVPFELWQLILEQVRVSAVDWIDLFKQSIYTK